MNSIDANHLLMQMRAMAARAQDKPETPAAAQEGTQFSSLMKSALDKVNETQQQAGALAKAFETGQSEVDIAEVMVALQKSRIAFEAVTQVRNRVVTAYQDIMNMPI